MGNSIKNEITEGIDVTDVWNRFWSVNLENLTSLTWLQKILCLILLKACSLLRMVLWQIFIRPPEMKQAKLICSMIKIVERFPVMQGTTIQSLPRDHSNWNRAALELLSGNPIFLKDENGLEYFWGFTIVVLRVPDIFSDAVSALSSFGYEYRISKTDAPWSDTYNIVSQSNDSLINPVSYTLR